jgi:hypothetical protein
MSKVFVKNVLLPAGIIALFFSACSDSGDGGTQPVSVSSAETFEDLPNCSKNREGDSAWVSADSMNYVCQAGKWAPLPTVNGDSTGTVPGSSASEPLAGGVETVDDLPNCSKNREGDSVLVAEDSLTYICRSGKWEEKKYLIDSVKTEDDLPACTKGHEGDSAYVSSEYAVYVCIENMWKKDQSIVQVYKSADDMPNCTQKLLNIEAISTADSLLYRCDGERWQETATTYATIDDLPNCTDNREGNQSFILDTRERFRCSYKQWVSVEL